VVERVYGGTNLGTGGLARAYGAAARAALETAEFKPLPTDVVTLVVTAEPSVAGAVLAAAARLEHGRYGNDITVTAMPSPAGGCDVTATVLHIVAPEKVLLEAAAVADLAKAGAETSMLPVHV
jgi:hypothetical protein